MRPQMVTALRLVKVGLVVSAGISSQEKPDLVSSVAIWISRRHLCWMPCLRASFSMANNSRSESTEWINWALPVTSFTLLVWRWPMKCHTMSLGSCWCLVANSWGRFSPKWRWPVWYASKIDSNGCSLETATNLMLGGRLFFIDVMLCVIMPGNEEGGCKTRPYNVIVFSFVVPRVVVEVCRLRRGVAGIWIWVWRLGGRWLWRAVGQGSFCRRQNICG